MESIFLIFAFFFNMFLQPRKTHAGFHFFLDNPTPLSMFIYIFSEQTSQGKLISALWSMELIHNTE